VSREDGDLPPCGLLDAPARLRCCPDPLHMLVGAWLAATLVFVLLLVSSVVDGGVP
jgi:hypothetical protein